MTEKHFFKIVNDYYISYDGDTFDLHKPSDIRSLCRIMNRLQGFTELECEYNEEYKKWLKNDLILSEVISTMETNP